MKCLCGKEIMSHTFVEDKKDGSYFVDAIHSAVVPGSGKVPRGVPLVVRCKLTIEDFIDLGGLSPYYKG